VLRARELVWDGCVNVRDLGGHRTEEGSETSFGAVVRADSVGKLTAAGWEAVTAYGVGRIVDLRLAEELAADPPRELGVEVVHISLLGKPDPEVWAEIDAVSAAAPGRVEAQRDVYLEFLRRWPENFAAAVVAVAQAPAGGVVVHCQGGKDRTGLVVALLLRLAGVPIEDVADDYALSAANLREIHDEWVAAAENDAERERRRRITACRRQTMAQVLEEVERRHDGVRPYLLAAGADDSELDAARARLLG
jgi:protein tyrosine/serine phosphatase